MIMKRLTTKLDENQAAQQGLKKVYFPASQYFPPVRHTGCPIKMLAPFGRYFLTLFKITGR